MRLKQVSKRQWKARMMRGLWIPRLVIEGHSLTPPDGCVFVWHPIEDFMRIAKNGQSHVFAVAGEPKRAWE